MVVRHVWFVRKGDDCFQFSRDSNGECASVKHVNQTVSDVFLQYLATVAPIDVYPIGITSRDFNDEPNQYSFDESTRLHLYHVARDRPVTLTKGN